MIAPSCTTVWDVTLRSVVKVGNKWRTSFWDLLSYKFGDKKWMYTFYSDLEQN
jgi:hypothetical protein